MKKHIITTISAIVLMATTIHAQDRMTLGEAIYTARNNSVEALEAKQAEIESLIEEFSSDYQKLTELQAESEEINAQLEEKMEQWMELSE